MGITVTTGSLVQAPAQPRLVAEDAEYRPDMQLPLVTGTVRNPFPEEARRVLVSAVAYNGLVSVAEQLESQMFPLDKLSLALSRLEAHAEHNCP